MFVLVECRILVGFGCYVLTVRGCLLLCLCILVLFMVFDCWLVLWFIRLCVFGLRFAWWWFGWWFACLGFGGSVVVCLVWLFTGIWLGFCYRMVVGFDCDLPLSFVIGRLGEFGVELLGVLSGDDFDLAVLLAGLLLSVL